MTNLTNKRCRYCGKPATQAEKVKVGLSLKTHSVIFYLCDKGFGCKGKEKDNMAGGVFYTVAELRRLIARVKQEEHGAGFKEGYDACKKEWEREICSYQHRATTLGMKSR